MYGFEVLFVGGRRIIVELVAVSLETMLVAIRDEDFSLFFRYFFSLISV